MSTISPDRHAYGRGGAERFLAQIRAMKLDYLERARAALEIRERGARRKRTVLRQLESPFHPLQIAQQSVHRHTIRGGQLVAFQHVAVTIRVQQFLIVDHPQCIDDFRGLLPAIQGSTDNLSPGNEAYLRRSAAVLEEIGRDGTRYYREATRIDPYDSANWLQLGFHAERLGHFQAAEQNLLEAAQVDGLVEPKWALANFYFRRGSLLRTRHLVPDTMSLQGGGLRAAVRLGWQATSDPIMILRGAVPKRPLVLDQ